VGDPGTDPGGTAAYYHADGLGSVRLITNASGAEVTRFDFLPFGQEPGASPHPNTIRFTGKERDPETAASATGWAALDYVGARYYQSQTGRFTSVDPVFTWEENLVDPQRWNRYAYVRNNPLRYTDPDGRSIKLFTLGLKVGQAFLEYGRRLVRPPDDAFAELDRIRVRTDGPEQWSVIMPLWTQEEGLSDLCVSLTLIARPEGGYRVELDDIHVP
jgi:RHS repeat-associated protein